MTPHTRPAPPVTGGSPDLEGSGGRSEHAKRAELQPRSEPREGAESGSGGGWPYLLVPGYRARVSLSAAVQAPEIP